MRRVVELVGLAHGSFPGNCAEFSVSFGRLGEFMGQFTCDRWLPTRLTARRAPPRHLPMNEPGGNPPLSTMGRASALFFCARVMRRGLDRASSFLLKTGIAGVKPGNDSRRHCPTRSGPFLFSGRELSCRRRAPWFPSAANPFRRYSFSGSGFANGGARNGLQAPSARRRRVTGMGTSISPRELPSPDGRGSLRSKVRA